MVLKLLSVTVHLQHLFLSLFLGCLTFLSFNALAMLNLRLWRSCSGIGSAVLLLSAVLHFTSYLYNITAAATSLFTFDCSLEIGQLFVFFGV